MRDIIRRAHRDGHAPEGAEAPADLWVRCPRCKELLYRPEHDESLWVCSKCKYHFRVSAPLRMDMTFDEGTFRERDSEVSPVDPLGFVAGSRSYREKLEQSAADTGRREGFIFGTGQIDGIDAVAGAIDMDFIGGSMGSVVGEKITRAMEAALEEHRPLVLFSSSGGARMQEGAVALLQLAKVLTRMDDLAAEGIPFISVMTDPCYGGVTASYAMLGDVNVAEPGAYIGFAGPRVIEQTTRQRLPPGAATSEFLLKHGMIDLVVPRSEMRSMLSRLLTIYGSGAVALRRPQHISVLKGNRERDERRIGV